MAALRQRRWAGQASAVCVTEVTPTHYKVRGLSDFARLGDIVEQRGQAGARRGEIVKISRDEVVIAPFERSADAGIGDAVFRRGPLAVAPHAFMARPRHRRARPGRSMAVRR